MTKRVSPPEISDESIFKPFERLVLIKGRTTKENSALLSNLIEKELNNVLYIGPDINLQISQSCGYVTREKGSRHLITNSKDSPLLHTTLSTKKKIAIELVTQEALCDSLANLTKDCLQYRNPLSVYISCQKFEEKMADFICTLLTNPKIRISLLTVNPLVYILKTSPISNDRRLVLLSKDSQFPFASKYSILTIKKFSKRKAIDEQDSL